MSLATAKPVSKCRVAYLALGHTGIRLWNHGCFRVPSPVCRRGFSAANDAWLTGEAGVLGDVAARTPKGALYGRVVREVAELASREVPYSHGDSAGRNDSVFFLQRPATVHWPCGWEPVTRTRTFWPFETAE